MKDRLQISCCVFVDIAIWENRFQVHHLTPLQLQRMISVIEELSLS